MIDKIKTYKKYLPKDPKYRGGFKAQVEKKIKRHGIVIYWAGGQQFTETIEEFVEKYEVK